MRVEGQEHSPPTSELNKGGRTLYQAILKLLELSAEMTIYPPRAALPLFKVSQWLFQRNPLQKKQDRMIFPTPLEKWI